MHTTVSIPASTCSIIASEANGAGTNISPMSGEVWLTASSTLPKIGIPLKFSPALVGWTPATTSVPYSIHFSVWKLPSLPKPWTKTLFESLFKIFFIFLTSC